MAKTPQKKRQAGDLSTVEIKAITDKLVDLREKLRATGRSALTPTPEWNVLRKEVAALNKILNADAAVKTKAATQPQ